MRFACVLGAIALLVGCGQANAPGVTARAPGATHVAAAEGNPVLLVHGHHGSSANFAALSPWLASQGFRPYALDFVTAEWKDWDLDALSDQVALQVEALRRRSGRDRVDVVAHSLGGIVVRHYIKFKGGDRTIAHLVCLGTPHHGVGAAALLPGVTIATIFRPHSRVLNAINRPLEAYGRVSYTNVWSPADYFEAMPFATGRMEGTFNVRVDDASHSGMTTDARIFPVVEEGLLRPLDAVPGGEAHVLKTGEPPAGKP